MLEQECCLPITISGAPSPFQQCSTASGLHDDCQLVHVGFSYGSTAALLWHQVAPRRLGIQVSEWMFLCVMEAITSVKTHYGRCVPEALCGHTNIAQADITMLLTFWPADLEQDWSRLQQKRLTL